MLALLDLEQDEVLLGGDQLHHPDGKKAPPLAPSADIQYQPPAMVRVLSGGLLAPVVC